MTSSRHEDAVARALDLLPADDPARTDPAFIGNPALAEKASATRETAVDVWLTVSPLTVAPAGILDQIMEELPLPRQETTAAPAHRRGLRMALAASGWAAAIVIACLWLVEGRNASFPQSSSDAKSAAEILEKSDHAETVDLNRPRRERTANKGNDHRLQDEILRLRAALGREEGREKAPRIKSLSPPGEPSTAEGGDLRRLLINALRSTLEAETGAPGDDAVLVIERGWPANGMTGLHEWESIRHRNFPEAFWQDLGLLRADDGSYYDPNSKIIWTRDPEGRGFIGRLAAEKDDLGIYHHSNLPQEATPGDTSPSRKSPETDPLTQSQPGGFLIENPQDSSVDVVIEGVRPPADGEQQWMVMVWTMPDGTVHEQPVDSSMFTPSGTLVGNISANQVHTGGFGQGGLPGYAPSGAINFQLQTRSSNGTVTETILQTGGN